MSVEWLFEIDETIYISTKSTTYNLQSYTGEIIPDSFSNIPEIRVKSEINSYGASNLSFQITDPDSTYSESDFEDKKLIIRLIIDDVEKRNWRFKIITASNTYKKWDINCKDYLATLIDGVWPNTGLIKDIFPEALVKVKGEYQSGEDDCVPVIFGTTYIPLQSLGEYPHIYFILGESGPTYNISELTTPHEQDGPTTYSSGLTYTQSTKSGQRVFIPSVTATGTELYWRQGLKRLSPLIKYNTTGTGGTSTVTNIIDVIKYIIKDWGAIDADFDSTTWTAAASTVTSRGLTFNKGYYKQKSRQSILCNLLNIAGANIIVGETLKIYLDSKTSAVTLTSSDIIGSRSGEGTVKYTRGAKNYNDSGNIEFNESGEPEDILINKIVPYRNGGTTDTPLNETLDVSGVSDTQDAQRIGILYYGKKLNKEGKVNFVCKYNDTLRSGLIFKIYDSVTGLYGSVPTKSIEVDSIRFNKDTTMDIEGIVRTTSYMSDWGDLSPSAISPSIAPTSDEITVYSKSIDYIEEKWDGTDVSTDFKADIYTAMIDGETFISGGYINTNFIQITSGLIVGGVPWGDITDDGNKPADNADVTASSTEGQLVQNWRYTGTTYIDGGDIYTNSITANSIATNTITLDRLYAADTGSITFTGCTMTFDSGADLILKSTNTNPSLLTMQNSTNEWTFQLNTSTGYLSIEPSNSGIASNYLILGNSTYTDGIQMFSDTFLLESVISGDMGQLNIGPAACDFKVGTTSAYIMYQFDSGKFAPYNTNISDPDLGENSVRWGTFYGASINLTSSASITGTCTAGHLNSNGNLNATSGTSNLNTVNITGTLSATGTSYMRNVQTRDLVPAASNTYYNGMSSAKWLQTHTEFLLVGGATYTSTYALHVKGVTTSAFSWSIVTQDSSSSSTFALNDVGYGYFVDGISCTVLTERSGKDFKENIVSVNNNAISKILKLKPKEYNYIGENEKNIGFIAEDIQDDFPLLVKNTGNKNPDTINKKILAIRYTGMIPYIVKCNQEQQDYIDALTDRIENLEKQLFKKGEK